jgi:hypothetical protein
LNNKVYADTILLNNGDKLTGSVVKFSSENCIFISQAINTPIEISWKKIVTLTTSQEYIILLNSEEKIIGNVNYSVNKGINIKSSTITVINLDIDKIIEGTLLNLKNQNKNNLDRNNIYEDDKKSEIENELLDEQEKKPPLSFLRGSSILLAPGEVEIRFLINYQPIKETSYGTSHQRFFSGTLGVNYGFHDRLEGWINIPFSYVRAHENSYFHQGRENRIGLRDLAFGINTLILPESVDWPELTGSLIVTVPTGHGRYDSNEMISFGSGHWSTDIGLNFVRSVDPAILFGGMSAGYIWPNTVDRVKYKYGFKYGYHFGFGFAINERLTFSSAFQGSYIPALSANGDKFGSFSTDPFFIIFGISYRLNNNYILEPSIRFGLNNDSSNNASLSFGISRKFN